MNNITINIDDNISIYPKNYKSFYYCSDFEIFKNGRHIDVAKYNEHFEMEIIARVECPLDYKEFNVIDSHERVVVILGGKYILEYDKDYNTLGLHEIPLNRMGRASNDIFWSGDHIMLTTEFNGQIQFVRYDYCNQKKLAQSASWKLKGASSVIANKKTLFAILDNTFVEAIDIETCEQIWSRFEAGSLSKGLLLYKNGVIYAKTNSLFVMNINGTFSKFRVTETKIEKLLDISGDKVFFVSNNGKDLCCYDLKAESLSWKISGNRKIDSGFICSGVRGKSKRPIMVLVADNHLGVADLSINFIKFAYAQGIKTVRKCGDCLLVDNIGDFSGIIHGEL